MRLKLQRHVHGFTDRYGKPRYYLRIPGSQRSIPLPGLAHSTEFLDAYAAGMAEHGRLDVGKERTSPGTVDALVVSYYQSTDFQQLAASTKSVQRAIVEQFRQKFGNLRVAALQRKHVVLMIEQKTPNVARALLMMLRKLMTYAVLTNQRDTDPTLSVKVKKPKSDGFHDWSDSEIALFEAYHPIGTKPRLAFALLLYTAQRGCSDVTRMGRQHFRNGELCIKQQKTGALVRAAIDPRLQAVLDATPLGDHLTFLIDESGKPFSPKSFGKWFAKQCKAAGVPDHCRAHGLRKAWMRRGAEAGLTSHELQSVSGHQTLKEVERYTRAADRTKLAGRAMAKLAG